MKHTYTKRFLAERMKVLQSKFKEKNICISMTLPGLPLAHIVDELEAVIEVLQNQEGTK